MADEGIDRKAEERMEFSTSKDVNVAPTFADMQLKVWTDAHEISFGAFLTISRKRFFAASTLTATSHHLLCSLERSFKSAKAGTR